MTPDASTQPRSDPTIINPNDEPTTLPVIKFKRDSTDHVIKEGLVLCTRTAEWYTKKKTAMHEVQLRKTRLRWRQFKAVLRPNRIELYHVTVSFEYQPK